MTLVFMGTSDFACHCLAGLRDGGFMPDLVITRPDRYAGRNRRLSSPPVKKWALQHGVEVWQPENINSGASVARLEALKPDLFVVAAYGKILSPKVLAVPRLGAVNVHASLLPDLRGAAPIEWAIILGYTETGITTMFMDAGLDTGDIILQQPVAIYPEDNGATLRERLGKAAQILLPETVRLVLDGKAPRIPQPPGEYTYAPALSEGLEKIDWQKPARDIANLVRALAPKPGCYCIFRQKRLKILRAALHSGQASPGLAIIENKKLLAGTGRDLLHLLEVQPEGKRPMSAQDFINGYRLQEGEIFQ
ncbi:MAG: methionyl-tRNA formyltransferase [Firmicutes bacterium]|jgi:methionyl-tRNA formyltransferase|nr:methionyl-tRNA formyltransferase [Bacillota bacterium]HOB34403.1 methionyl-tRNA formyltransferase [Bacillota bacterium]HPZ89857.1 methionyl-tRNA formyltransferase [Bacillota bacterium]HQE01127.1 methionyl-tRNA formyltransferase [Bacillota bacterium]